MMKRKWVWIGFMIAGLSGGGAIYWWIVKSPPSTPNPSPSASPSLPDVREFAKVPGNRPEPQPESKKESRGSKIVTLSADRQAELWKDFQGRFGKELRPKFTKNGLLVSVQGRIGTGTPASPDFEPRNSEKTIARAREILGAAGELLGVQEDWPLGKAVAQGSPVSAQVFLSETYEGVHVEPLGQVKVDLGSKGELIGLESAYVPGLSIANEFQMGMEEANRRAIASVGKHLKEGALGLDELGGGEKIIWVRDGKGFFSYGFHVGGYRVVIDAKTGEELFRRNMRQY